MRRKLKSPPDEGRGQLYSSQQGCYRRLDTGVGLALIQRVKYLWDRKCDGA